jgi:acyl-coenzyme A synthetase/AMP-(fatty) acid ligase
MITAVQPTLSLCADVRGLRPAAVLAHSADWSAELEAVVREIAAAGFTITDADGGFGVAPRPGLERMGSDALGRAADDVAILVPTSGTTGPPKRISVTWQWLNGFVREVEAPVVQGRGLIHAIPLATAGGVLTMMRWAAPPMILVLMERVDVTRWADLVERHRPKFAGLPPAGLRSLLDARVPREKFASLAAFVTGSAPLDPALAEALEEAYGKPVLLTYGSTETGKVSQWPKNISAELRRAKRGSSGKVAKDVQVRILDPETSAPLPTGEVGLIEVKSPHARLSTDNGWVRTTDLGRVDEDGFIYVEGRADDVIIRGGFKVSLLELDRVMAEHPAVARCAATGLPDARLGQVPAALIVVRRDVALTEADFLAWLRERVSPYKVPIRVRFVDDLPLTPMLKTNRRSLSMLFADEGSAQALAYRAD